MSVVKYNEEAFDDKSGKQLMIREIFITDKTKSKSCAIVLTFPTPMM